LAQAPPLPPHPKDPVARRTGRIKRAAKPSLPQPRAPKAPPLRHAPLCPTQPPQAALHARSPLQAIKDGHKLKPELFKKRPYQRAGCDTYGVKYERSVNKLVKDRDVLLTFHRLCPFTPQTVPRTD